MFLHCWDLALEGIDPLMGSMVEAGLNTMCVAATYHSGWFIHPHSRGHRLYMSEGSACYFQPQSSLYRKLRLKPQVASICRTKDWLREAGKRLERHGLRMVAWTIGTHNSRLGAAHPELTQQNVYGDRIPYALCPANEHVRKYLKTLCRDLACNYPFWALQLESFGWMGCKHGHHHERDLVGLSDLEAELLGMCVCPACSRGARAADVKFADVKRLIRETLESAFRAAPLRPKGHPHTMRELEDRYVELKRFNRWRRQLSHSLIAEIKNESLRGTNCRLLLQTEPETELMEAVDGFACSAYHKDPLETARACQKVKCKLPSDWSGLLQCLVQLGQGIPRSEAQLRGIVRAVKASKFNGINFYNRSESPPKMLAWLSKVMSAKLDLPFTFR